MTRKFKALGLALFATLALGAMMASTASATEFTAASYPVKYTGTQDATQPHVFTADNYETRCKDASFSGEATATSTTATLVPVYKECTTASLGSVVNMNGCDYLLHLSASGTAATVDLVCGAGKSAEIILAGGVCIIHIPAFTGKAKVELSNTHPNITGAASVSGITALLTKSSFLCPFKVNSTVVNTATYIGHLTVSGGATTIDIG